MPPQYIYNFQKLTDMTITNLITLTIIVVVIAVLGGIIGVLTSLNSAKAEMHNCKKNIAQHKEGNKTQNE